MWIGLSININHIVPSAAAERFFQWKDLGPNNAIFHDDLVHQFEARQEDMPL